MSFWPTVLSEPVGIYIYHPIYKREWFFHWFTVFPDWFHDSDSTFEGLTATRDASHNEIKRGVERLCCRARTINNYHLQTLFGALESLTFFSATLHKMSARRQKLWAEPGTCTSLCRATRSYPSVEFDLLAFSHLQTCVVGTSVNHSRKLCQASNHWRIVRIRSVAWSLMTLRSADPDVFWSAPGCFPWQGPIASLQTKSPLQTSWNT